MAKPAVRETLIGPFGKEVVIFERRDRPGVFRAFIELPPGPDHKRRRKAIDGGSPNEVRENAAMILWEDDGRPGSVCACSGELDALKRAALAVIESQHGTELWQSLVELRAVLREVERRTSERVDDGAPSSPSLLADRARRRDA